MRALLLDAILTIITYGLYRFLIGAYKKWQVIHPKDELMDWVDSEIWPGVLAIVLGIGLIIGWVIAIVMTVNMVPA